MKIAIVGAGLGGLAAATILSKAGHTVVVFERQRTLSPQGGIIGLRPSALKVLYAHGLQDELEATTLPLGETQFAILANGQPVRNVDLREEQVAGEGLTRLTTRAKLAAMLHKAAVEAAARLEFGKGVGALEEEDEGVKVKCEDGKSESADLVLVADGIRSRLRGKILDDLPPEQCEPIVTDATLYVFQLPAKVLSDEVRQRMFQSNGPWVRMTAWLGKDSWAMSAFDTTYDTVDAGITIVEPTDQTSLWDEDGNIEYVREHFKTRACNEIREVLQANESCDRWRLAYMPSLPRWTSARGRIALLGDSAHAILPNGGAGITLTIEDVGTLEHLLSACTPTENVPKMMRLWQQVCKPRADKLREYGVFNMRRMEGDAEALAETEKALKEEVPNRKDAVPDVNAQFSTLAFTRWLSGYDPVAAADKCIRRQGVRDG